ncbi:MAG: hypothetical protein GC165_02355 [Armatimonadetes bacterium]|nr:hypothetical protein [Armatimonadota bacterium]
MKYESRGFSDALGVICIIAFVSLLPIGALISRRVWSGCNTDQCISTPALATKMPNIVNKRLSLSPQMQDLLKQSNGLAILYSTGCSACNKVDLHHLSKVSREYGYAKLLLAPSSIDLSSFRDFAKADITPSYFASDASNTPNLLFASPQLFLVNSKGIVTEHLIGAIPINGFGGSK